MIYQSMFLLGLGQSRTQPVTAVLFIMTAYKGIHSFRGEQTSDIIKLLVREYVLIQTLVHSLIPFAAEPCFT